MSVHAAEHAGPDATAAAAGPAADPVAGPAVGSAVQSRRPLVAGGFVGLWALLVGVALVTVLVMVSWTLAPRAGGDAAAAWRASGLAWLAAHHVPLTISGHPLTLVPLGALLLPLLLTRRGGAWTGRLLPEPSTREVAEIAAAAGLAYAAGGAGVAWLSSAATGSVALLEAGLITGLVATLGTTWGLAREGDLVGRLRRHVPEPAWRIVIGGLAAVGMLVAAGAALTSISLVLNLTHVASAMSDFDAGPAGAVGLTVLSALSLPNLAVWMASLMAGPGFQIGTTGTLSALGGSLDTLPAFPILAVIPATSPGWAPLLLLVPVLAGGLASRIRWARDLPTVSSALLASIGLAAVVCLLTGPLMWLSGGALGSGELSWVGPRVLPVTAATTGLVTFGFLADGGLQGLRLVWTLHRGEQRTSRSAQAGPHVEASDERAIVDAAEWSDDSRPASSGGAGPQGRFAVPGALRLAARLGGAPGAVGSKLSGAGAAAISVIVGPSGIGAPHPQDALERESAGAGDHRADEGRLPTTEESEAEQLRS